MMLDYRLNELIDMTYDAFDIPNIRKENMSVFTKIINDVEKKYDRIGVYGIGEHTDELIKYLCIDRIIAFIDKKCDTVSYREKPVVRTCDDLVKGLDCIVISSFLYRRQMEFALSECGFAGRVVDIYDEFRNNGIYMTQPFYRFDSFCYDDVYLMLNRLNNIECDDEEKQDTFKKLIISFFELRDFRSLIRYIDFYIDYRMDNYEKLILIRSNIVDFFDDIKTKINNRNKKDIIVNWIDAVGNRIDDMPFLCNEVSNSIYFENSFTVVPWTSSVIESICFGDLNIDGKLFDKKPPFDNSPLIVSAEENGYRFFYTGDNSRAIKYFEKNHIESKPYVYFWNSNLARWGAIMELYSNENPMVIIIHTLNETHDLLSPYSLFNIFSDEGYSEDTSIRFDEERSASHRYIDEQLEWFSSFYPNDSTIIYFSDHGDNFGYKHSFEDYRSRIFFAIKNERIKPKVYKELFSLFRFSDVLLHIYSENYSFDDVLSEYVPLQGYDAYSELSVSRIIKGLEVNKDVSIMQYRGIRSSYDKYVRYVDGREFYYILPDESCNLIDDVRYESRIAELRELSGANYIDIYKYDRFKATEIIYKQLGLEIKFDENENVIFD